MLDVEMDQATAKKTRAALRNWGFTSRCNGADQPEEVTELLGWIARHSRPLSHVAQPQVARAALEAISTKLDGTRAAAMPTRVKRANLLGALGHAVEVGFLDENPLKTIKWKAPRAAASLDRRVVVNPEQAAWLLHAVAHAGPSGPRLVAFFGCMYYSALRPEEAVNVRVQWLDLPPAGAGDAWGWMLLQGATPEVDKHWTDSGVHREARELKHRGVGDTRRVPVPLDLATMLRQHLARFGTDADGRLFTGLRGHPISGVTYTRVWDRARRAALTETAYQSPLARRPYDLRHAAVSTWLNSGVGPTRVAEWAGHSVDVLLKTYAKCIDGQEQDDLTRISHALRNGNVPRTPTMPRS
jgi:integrase